MNQNSSKNIGMETGILIMQMALDIVNAKNEFGLNSFQTKTAIESLESILINPGGINN